MSQFNQHDGLIESLISDRLWRLNNLYSVTDEQGRDVRFNLNLEQKKLAASDHDLHLILKARQLGITTFYCIDTLDACLFNSNINCAIIADDLDDARAILRKKIKFAYDRLPETIKDRRQLVVDSAERIVFSNNSSISVTTSARSSTIQRLHITEFGRICRKSPEKAAEIISGSLNAIHLGQKIIIESTAQGSDGKFYDMCQNALSMQRLNVKLSPLDYKFFFFPWFDHPNYRLKGPVDSIVSEVQEYFKQIEDDGLVLDNEQKFWYFKKWEVQKDVMKSEFPATPEEAFEQAIIGAYFSNEFRIAEEKQRITNVSYDSSLPVHTAWDIGMSDYTGIWFYQKRGFDYLIIDYLEGEGEPMPYYLDIASKKDYKYGKHFLPHDIVKRSFYDGKDGLEVAKEFGYNFTKIERPQSKIEVINQSRMIFNRCFFDSKKCETGLKRLRNYRKKWNEVTGRFADYPLHDINSHGADAFQTLALSTKRLEEQNTTKILQSKIPKRMDWIP